jgi:hypothetical protein
VAGGDDHSGNGARLSEVELDLTETGVRSD